MQFQILCDQDIAAGAGNFCSYGQAPENCPQHANSLEQCLEYCSEAHPLCKAVSWNVDGKSAYGNCYLKSDPSGGLNASDINDGTLEHSALITPDLFTSLDTGCEDKSTYISSRASSFEVSCYNSREGGQNSSSHANSLAECADRCSPQSDMQCKGVVYDQGLGEGFENCYLMTDLGAPLPGVNMTYAQMLPSSDNDNDQTQGDDTSESASSKAWIAGPVLGALVILGLAGGGLWWWRRRRHRYARPNDLGDNHKAGSPVSTRVEAPATGLVEKDNDIVGSRAVELHDPDSERLYRHEI